LKQKYRDLTRQALANAVDPQSPDYMEFKDGKQPLVDAAYLAQGMLRAPHQLWDLSSDKVKADLEVYNTEIAALSQLAQQYSAGSAVTSVDEIKDGDKTVGYKISFDNGTSINVMYGQDGADGRDGVDGADGHIGTDAVDGHSPVVGLVYQDGAYYWTVDGQLLKDANGNPVPASANSAAAAAKPGSTPQVSLEDGKWYVTLDGVKTEVGSVTATEATMVVDGIFADENAVVKGE
jgi:hypothetical protein